MAGTKPWQHFYSLNPASPIFGTQDPCHLSLVPLSWNQVGQVLPTWCNYTIGPAISLYDLKKKKVTFVTVGKSKFPPF